MPRINQYSENTTIENDDKVLTYDTQAAATKITPFSTIWNWIVSKLHALTSSGAALAPSTDRVLMDKNGTMTRVEPAAVAKYGIETYNGSTIAGSAQTVKSALDTLNSKSVGANAGGHNSIFRGKNLGTAVTAAQWAAISAGTFDDLFVGDYWVINGVNWRIAALDYWLNCGDQNCTTHHAVIVPDSNLLNGDGSTTHWMNTANTTEGGYMGSGFYTGVNADESENTGKAQCLTKAQNAFGASHLLTHREYLSNAVTNGYVSGGTWVDSTIDLMNESMVYGNRFFENVMCGTNIPAAYTIDKGQLPLFALAPQYITNRAAWWLRSVVSSANFAVVNTNGSANCNNASGTWNGVRPAFGIK